MYTTGSEFDYEIDGNIEYFTCIGETIYSGIEYLICESEDGMKKVFFYEEEELELVDDEEEEESIIDHYQEEAFKLEEKEFEYWEDNDFTSDYDGYTDEGLDSDSVIEEDDMVFLGEENDEEIDDFLDELFEDEN